MVKGKAAWPRLGVPGFVYADLHRADRLRELLQVFDDALAAKQPALYKKYQGYRDRGGQGLPATELSELLVQLAPHVGDFIADLFGIRAEREQKRLDTQRELDTVFSFRKQITKQLKRKFSEAEPASWDSAALQEQIQILLTAPEHGEKPADPEQRMCELGLLLQHLSLQKPDQAQGEQLARLRRTLEADPAWVQVFAAELKLAGEKELAGALLEVIERWCWLCLQRSDLHPQVRHWACLKPVEKNDFRHLVAHESEAMQHHVRWIAPKEHRRQRNGFQLSDRRGSLRQTLYEVEHCIYCHERDTDSCSKGMHNRHGGGYRKNALGNDLIGCPLGEKISEMHVLKRKGDDIAALAVIMIDNPTCPGTGHRICNDCMKGCIYQKTEPVDIPQIETRVLTDVLALPWGFEIYSLLSRWNPLNAKRPCTLPYNGKNVLVVGMGPAGYTLAYYLLNEGFGVVGIDALKIEPLPAEWIGQDGIPQPVRDFSLLYEELDQRVMTGFGGVAEYGITVRWDKNFLKVIYLTLARRGAFRCYGGVRFGGTLNIEDAWELGFHHIALATGAGKPAIIGLRNNLMRGIRKASDFLMALQLNGAAREDSLANLQIRLPVGVIGGGLTAIDAATEALAYYPVQVKKILQRYEALVSKHSESNVRGFFNEEELEILDEFLRHARELRAERERARRESREADFASLLDRWGGSTLIYRRAIQDSPAYRQNHEEVRHALHEGIRLVEKLSPVEAVADRWGALQSLQLEHRVQEDGKWRSEGKLEMPLKTLFIAAGTSPNTIYEQEYPYTFRMDRDSFQRYELSWSKGQPSALIARDDEPIPKIGRPAPFTSYHRNGRYITFYGDTHPVYAGSVVKAMASAKDGYPCIVRLFEAEIAALDAAGQGKRDQDLQQFFRRLDEQLLASVFEVRRLTPTIVECLVKAPMQARKFEPGQFYRVQNYQALSPTTQGTLLNSEGLALTGAWVDKERGLISLIALEMGSSSKLCALWKPGDPLVVMGVTGSPTQIVKDRTIMLAGGGLGNAVHLSIGKALRAAGCRVLYFAGYRKHEDVFKIEALEQAADLIVWAVDPSGPDPRPLPVSRPQDKSVIGNIVQAMLCYAKGELGPTPIPMQEVDHIIAIGSDRMMAAIKQARHDCLSPYLKPGHTAIGSINSPMQCMMKGVCAQCLCKHIHPESSEEYFVYSCYNQDQELDRVDFENLDARLRQNSVQEKLSSLWLDHVLETDRNDGDKDAQTKVRIGLVADGTEAR